MVPHVLHTALKYRNRFLANAEVWSRVFQFYIILCCGESGHSRTRRWHDCEELADSQHPALVRLSLQHYLSSDC